MQLVFFVELYPKRTEKVVVAFFVIGDELVEIHGRENVEIDKSKWMTSYDITPLFI